MVSTKYDVSSMVSRNDNVYVKMCKGFIGVWCMYNMYLTKIYMYKINLTFLPLFHSHGTKCVCAMTKENTKTWTRLIFCEILANLGQYIFVCKYLFMDIKRFISIQEQILIFMYNSWISVRDPEFHIWLSI